MEESVRSQVFLVLKFLAFHFRQCYLLKTNSNTHAAINKCITIKEQLNTAVFCKHYHTTKLQNQGAH